MSRIFQPPTNLDRRWIRGLRLGFSLLEVILALTILSMTAAILAQLIQNATDNAIASQNALEANLICESKLAELTVAATQILPTDWTEVTDFPTAHRQWFSRIETETQLVPNIIIVTISVGDAFAVQQGGRPTACLTRWVVDPALQLDMPAAAADPASAAAGTSAGGPPL